MKLFLVASAVVLLATSVAAFKVCGYYCGPNWCSDEVISEQQCVATGVWGIAPASGNCADSCCRVHDHCCGAGEDRPACNDAIVQCIQTNRCYFSVCGALVWAAMKTVDDWCCGSPCPTYFMPTAEVPEMTLAAKTYCSASGLRVTFSAKEVLVTSPHRACTPVAYTLNQTSHDVVVAWDACQTEAFDNLNPTMTYLPYPEKLAYTEPKYQQLSLCN